MFVPPSQVENFRNVTLIGIYGSNLFSTDFETILQKTLEGLLELQKTCHHPLLNKKPHLPL
jgi:hypothetical protein